MVGRDFMSIFSTQRKEKPGNKTVIMDKAQKASKLIIKQKIPPQNETKTTTKNNYDMKMNKNRSQHCK